MTRKLIDDCFLSDSDRMPHNAAIDMLKSRIAPVAGAQKVAIAEAAGRVLAEPAIARMPVPAHTNSAVDGFAFAYSAYLPQDGVLLPVAGRAAAGHPLLSSPGPDKAVRIFTGAVMPEGLDTVVMQEDCQVEDATGAPCPFVSIPPGLKRGSNVRLAGEDVAAGATLFKTGALLRPQDVAALASIGLSTVTCYRRLSVAIVSTGDEVIRPGDRPLGTGEVFDANAPMLKALAQLAGAEVEDLGVWKDDARHIQQRLMKAAEHHDVVLTSGGASKGEEDHLVDALDAIGKRHMWQIAVKPGRPMMFGQIGDTVMVGLPGNPVAVFVCFLMYVYPMLRRLSGSPWPEPRRFSLPAAFDIEKRKTGRREFLRGFLVPSESGMAVDKFARDGSGLITGLRMADGLIDIPEDVPAVRRGEAVSYIPFSEFGILGR